MEIDSLFMTLFGRVTRCGNQKRSITLKYHIEEKAQDVTTNKYHKRKLGLFQLNSEAKKDEQNSVTVQINKEGVYREN